MNLRLGLTLVVLVACGGAADPTTTVAAATTTVETTTAPTTSEQASTTTAVRAEGEASLEFAGDVQAGTEFEVTWTGPDNEDDFVTIVSVGAREGAFEDYFYTSEGATGTLSAPTTPGDHEIRYVNGASDETLASEPIAIAGRVITLELPVTVAAGTEFEVTWEAIHAEGDYITIVLEAADEGTSSESYFYTEDGPTGTLIAPITEGEYEIRFVSGLDSATMAASSITVTPLEITIDAPASVAASEEFEVSWTGPDGPGDYLTIVPVGADSGAYLSYEYTRVGSPLTLVAPDEVGDYEIRYRSDRVGEVFFSVPIIVG